MVGLFLTIGRFLADGFLRGRAHYAVTDRRVLITRSAPFPLFTALTRDRLADIRLTEQSRGQGTIAFGGLVSNSGNRSFSAWMPSLDSQPQLLGIDDAAAVMRILSVSSEAEADA